MLGSRKSEQELLGIILNTIKDNRTQMENHVLTHTEKLEKRLDKISDNIVDVSDTLKKELQEIRTITSRNDYEISNLKKLEKIIGDLGKKSELEELEEETFKHISSLRKETQESIKSVGQDVKGFKTKISTVDLTLLEQNQKLDQLIKKIEKQEKQKEKQKEQYQSGKVDVIIYLIKNALSIFAILCFIGLVFVLGNEIAENQEDKSQSQLGDIEVQLS